MRNMGKRSGSKGRGSGGQSRSRGQSGTRGSSGRGGGHTGGRRTSSASESYGAPPGNRRSNTGGNSGGLSRYQGRSGRGRFVKGARSNKSYDWEKIRTRHGWGSFPQLV